MKATPAAIPDVPIVEPPVFGDDRGSFDESFNARKFRELTGLDPVFRPVLSAMDANGVALARAELF